MEEREALLALSETEGWKIIEKMIIKDLGFSSSILRKQKPPVKDGSGRIISEFKDSWETDPHSIGYARGIFRTAEKYINKVKNASNRGNKIEEEGAI